MVNKYDLTFLYIILTEIKYFNYFYTEYEKERYKDIIGR
jgi:hypothetical protein